MTPFEQALRALARTQPSISLVTALRMVTMNPEGHELETIQGQAAWILEHPDIRLLLADKKIHAIKEVRAHLGIGLKEAKEAVELAVQMEKDGYLTKAERDALDKEAQAAMASILGIEGT